MSGGIGSYTVLDARLGGHPAFAPVHALQRELVRCGARIRRNDSPVERLASRAVVRLGLQRCVIALSRQRFFGVVINLPARWIYPQALWSRGAIYCFDCWQPRWDEWERFLRANAFDAVFLSARHSAEEMARRLPGLRIAWMPEAIDPAPYSPGKSLPDRSIDILEFGRPAKSYHASIVQHCQVRGYNHLYRTGSAWLFATEHELFAALADARLVVCLPQSLTDPERAGSVETMTLRYLEAIASGALIIGVCPREMIDLFGYNPVLTIDDADPTGQIDRILIDLPAYEPLRARNLARLAEIGTWEVRARQIADYLSHAPTGARSEKVPG